MTLSLLFKANINAVKALANFTKNCSIIQANKVIEHGILNCFTTMLSSSEIDIVITGLEAVEGILDHDIPESSGMDLLRSGDGSN